MQRSSFWLIWILSSNFWTFLEVEDRLLEEMKRWKKDGKKNNFFLIYFLLPSPYDQKSRIQVFTHTQKERTLFLFSCHELRSKNFSPWKPFSLTSYTHKREEQTPFYWRVISGVKSLKDLGLFQEISHPLPIPHRNMLKKNMGHPFSYFFIINQFSN